jgi:hypothetical protein
VKYGTLLPEFREKEGDSIRFRLSDALRFDFKELKKESKVKATKQFKN